MVDLSRQSAFMPTIKCSNCGNQVEISMMGDHVCGSGTGSAASERTSIAFSTILEILVANIYTAVPLVPDLLGGTFSSIKQNVFDKFTRAPPTVDTSAASKYTAYYSVGATHSDDVE